MGLFGCTHKAVATGVPLVDAIYGSSSSVGLYTLPLLIWHPMQLVVGTFLVPRLVKFVDAEEKRLGLKANDDDSGSGKDTPADQTDPECSPDSDPSSLPNGAANTEGMSALDLEK